VPRKSENLFEKIFVCLPPPKKKLFYLFVSYDLDVMVFIISVVI